MISERCEPITIINSVVVKNVGPQNISRDSHSITNQEYLYDDPFKETQEEWKRILNKISKPCPSDFPKELKPYWKGHLEFSLTPYESGWMYLNEMKKTKRRK